MLGRRENNTGRIITGEYPKDNGHSLGLYEILELIGANANLTDLDDHTRGIAGGVLLGLNLGRHQSAKGLDLSRSFREKDL